eukprot:Nk52_evm25s1073 gene=Nk52_evmTU25s1073
MDNDLDNMQEDVQPDAEEEIVEEEGGGGGEEEEEDGGGIQLTEGNISQNIPDANRNFMLEDPKEPAPVERTSSNFHNTKDKKMQQKFDKADVSKAVVPKKLFIQLRDWSKELAAVNQEIIIERDRLFNMHEKEKIKGGQSQKLLAELASTKHELQTTKEHLFTATEKAKRTNRMCHQYQHKVKALEEEIKQVREHNNADKVEKLEVQLDKMKSSMQKMRKTLELARKENSTLNFKLDGLKDRDYIVSLENNVVDLRNQIQNWKKERQSLIHVLHYQEQCLIKYDENYSLKQIGEDPFMGVDIFKPGRINTAKNRAEREGKENEGVKLPAI